MYATSTMRRLLRVETSRSLILTAGDWLGCIKCLDLIIGLSSEFGQNRGCVEGVDWFGAMGMRHDGVGLLHHRFAQLSGLRSDFDAVGGGARSGFEALPLLG